MSLSPVWRLLYRRLLSLLSNEVIKLEAKPKVGCAYKCDAKGGSEGERRKAQRIEANKIVLPIKKTTYTDGAARRMSQWRAVGGGKAQKIKLKS